MPRPIAANPAQFTSAMGERWGPWVCDNPQHIVINFAQGGGYRLKINGVKEPYVGLPQATAEMVKRGEVAMEVDWVRVYAPN